MTFWDLYEHYFTDNHPPVIIDKVTHKLVRHGGSSDRGAFWAGYDGLRGGLWPPPRNSGTGRAYRAGVAYRRSSRPDLPGA